MDKKKLFPSVFGLFCMAFGGLLLHYKIHPPSKDVFNWIGIAFPFFNTFILPFMFIRPKAWRWAYLINAVSVIVGVIAMTAFSIKTWDKPVTFTNILVYSTFADSVILLAKLPLAYQIKLIWEDHGKN